MYNNVAVQNVIPGGLGAVMIGPGDLRMKMGRSDEEDTDVKAAKDIQAAGVEIAPLAPLFRFVRFISSIDFVAKSSQSKLHFRNLSAV